MANPVTPSLRLLCCALWLMTGTVRAAEPLLAVGDEWCPFNCAADNPQPGYLVELLRDIYGAAGQPVAYRVVPWSRALRMLDTGKADLLLATTPETSPKLLLSVPVGVDLTCFFVPADSHWRYRDMAELQQQRLGVIQDYNYDGGGALDSYLASNPQDNPRILASSGKNALHYNFNKLLAGRVDIVLENCSVGAYSLQRYGLQDRISAAGHLPGYRGELNIAFNPADSRSRHWASLLRKGLQQRRQNGELSMLLKTYGLTDWVEQP